MFHTLFDRFAIALSGLCAIHCVALPLVASITPLLISTIEHGNGFHEFWFHQFILIFILPASIIALITGYHCHKQLTPMLIGCLGLMILVITALFAEYLITKQFIPHYGETVLTISGGLIHAIGHIANILATKNFHASCAAK